MVCFRAAHLTTWRRIETTASVGHTKATDIGYGIVNAYRAVGGFHTLRMDGPTCVDQWTEEVTLTAMPYGDGPFSYRWHDGTTGRLATFPAPAPGEVAEYAVYVTDGLEGKTMAAYHRVEKLSTSDTRITC